MSSNTEQDKNCHRELGVWQPPDIDGHPPPPLRHFRCPRANLAKMKNHHYIFLQAIILKQFLEILHTYFSLLLTCEWMRPYASDPTTL